MKKQDGLWQVIEKVLTGVEWVGSLASSIGGLFFPPAGACFSAIEALINIPRLLKKLADDLRKLFDRIMSSVSNLKILRRADAQLGLDGELVRKTNEILMCLVKVYAIAIHARDHKWSTISSSLFLGDDKMQAALEDFKTHCDDQNKLITTVTLEEAMQTRSMTKDIHGRTIIIEGQAREANVGIKDLRADNAHRKNKEATQDMVSQIQKEWRIHEAETASLFQELGPCMAELLPGTFEALAKDDQYSAWLNETNCSRLLYLSGDVGTGRTFLLAALTRQVEEEKKTLTEGDPSIYLVYYAFKGADEASADKAKSKDTAMHAALKIMACRLAQQSITYAKLLSELYRSSRDKTLEDLWTHLKFEHFDAPANSILYLCFDGADQLKNPKPFVDVLDTIITNHRTFNSGSKLKLRVILTGKDDTLTKRLSIPTIDIKELNKPVIKQYVQCGMRDIVDGQDTDTLSSSELLVDAIRTSAEGSSSAANQRLKIVEDAIHEDLDFEEVLERVKSQKITTDEQEGYRTLAKSWEALKPHYHEQLKEIMYWCTFGVTWPTLSMLQASLLLQRQARSLESSERKIRTRFAKVLSVRGERVAIEPRVDQYIRSVESGSSPSSGSVGDLDFAINLDSEVTSKQSHADQLTVSTVEGQYTIIKRCLQALNEDDPAIRGKIRSVLEYPVDWLPEYVLQLRGNIHQLEPERCKLVGQGLIEFFSDEECIDLVWTEKQLMDMTWVKGTGNFSGLGQLLKEKTILQGLSPKNQRIARRTTQQIPGRPAPFLELLAIRVVSHWLKQISKVAREEGDDQDRYTVCCCYRFLKEFFDLVRLLLQERLKC